MSEQTDIQAEVFSERRSALAKYRRLVIGEGGLGRLLRYELTILLCRNLPGALGLWLRSKLYPPLLGSCGRNVHFGTNVTLRHPHKIRVGDHVAIDDLCVLDAKGTSNDGIRIGQGVFLGRNTILSCKNGDISLGNRVNIGFNCEIFSGSRVALEDDVLVAAYTYLIGGGHASGESGRTILEQERTSLGIRVGPRAWLGAGVLVQDGVSIGADAIVGAGAVVTRNVEDRHVVAGVPARLLRARD